MSRLTSRSPRRDLERLVDELTELIHCLEREFNPQSRRRLQTQAIALFRQVRRQTGPFREP